MHMSLNALVAVVCGLLFPIGHRSNSPSPFINDTKFSHGFRGAYPIRSYHSFELVSPHVNILEWDDYACDDGTYIALAPYGSAVPNVGPMLLKPDGELVWMDDSFGTVENVRVQKWNGEDYITFWAGQPGFYNWAYGRGEYFLLNSSYDVVKKIKLGGDLLGDLHEFHITPEGTALMTIYDHVIKHDDGRFCEHSPCWIIDSLFQEIDIDSGDVLFEWRASEHFFLNDSAIHVAGKGTEKKPFDFFHINSIDKDSRGNYLISGRHFGSIVCISPVGDTLWILGGKLNMFTGASNGKVFDMFGQHHARFMNDTTVSIFDNGAINDDTRAPHSRALIVSLDLDNMTVTLDREFYISDVMSASQGSMQVLPENDNIFVGWGQTPSYTQFSPGGEVLCNIQISPPIMTHFRLANSYRTFKVDWIGRPRTRPSISRLRPGDEIVHVSWNGATEIVSWRLEGGEDLDKEYWTTIIVLPKSGFETAIPLVATLPFSRYRAIALDARDEVLGMSAVTYMHAPSQNRIMQPVSVTGVSLWFCVGLMVTTCGRYAVKALLGTNSGRRGSRLIFSLSGESIKRHEAVPH